MTRSNFTNLIVVADNAEEQKFFDSVSRGIERKYRFQIAEFVRHGICEIVDCTEGVWRFRYQPRETQTIMGIVDALTPGGFTIAGAEAHAQWIFFRPWARGISSVWHILDQWGVDDGVQRLLR